MHYIYVIINKLNNKIYVGQTIDPKSRWQKHLSCSKNVTYNHPLYNSIRKYGIENFYMEEIDQCLLMEEANEKEKYWITYLQTQDRRFGYNIAYGGDNYKLSQETKDKLSIINSGEGNPFYGKTHSEETKQILSQYHIGTVVSNETKNIMSDLKIGELNPMYGKNHTENSLQKMSAAKIGKYDGENNPFYGKYHSDETKNKISQINKGKTLSEETKKKISESLLGKMAGENNPMYGKIGADNPMYGIPRSDETKKKISVSMKGKKRNPMSDETKRKIAESRKGKKYPRTS